MRYYDRIIHYSLWILTLIGLVFIFSGYTVPRLIYYLTYVEDTTYLLQAFKPFFNLLPMLLIGFAFYYGFIYLDKLEFFFERRTLGRKILKKLSRIRLGKFINILVWLTIFLMTIVWLEKFIFGLEVNRWLLGPQKKILITGLTVLSYYLFLAYQLAKDRINWQKVLGISCIYLFLLLMQPDVGTSILLLFSFVTLSFFRFFNLKKFVYFFYFLTSSIGVLSFFAILNANVKLQLPNLFEGTKFGHVIERINNWLDPFRDVTSSSYQLANSLYAVHRGGIDGVGFGFGYRKLYMGPTVHTDFIFATIGEETGFIFAVFIFGVTLVLLLRLLVISFRISNPFEKFFIILVAIETFLLSFINAGMAVNLIPSKGWPYPLISYAPFYVVFYIIQLGIVQFFVQKRFYEVY
ncbi:MAG TPA: FtsW/RodA/SpoVE family cell cycle protein [Aquifex aeolicus]|uniref:Probable peptidoglycan glycosyltransferase FtsW n=1 Tax=Aquifex aeolicus TaxID=63363 RepID=A0A9D1CFC6_AQUAO|nr:FtsW/RodA/SpoVE family cell cycle protein [Aquifex aeolicus]HIQ25864.1 FtsW/RodA/SpoVE family cell cycle protein [Aquifex aeolicus]